MPPMTFASIPVRGSQHSSREEGAEAREQILVRKHASVMPKESLALLDLHDGETVVDATYGQGGHSKAIKKALPAGRQAPKIKLITIDADPVSEADIVANFGDLDKVLGAQKVNKVLFDLGWNLSQLDSGRGFSFLRDEPLNMSYGLRPRSGFTAAEVLNTWSEKAIADALFGYGEERYARRIARGVVERRAIEPIASTIEFVEIIKDAVPAAYRRGRLHPATKSFQGLRMAVNDELGAVDEGLRAAWKHLARGGRIVVITFHSIEDRAVKRLFASWTKAGEGKLVVKKPLIASATEVKQNPPSRSAKMRAIEKI